MAVVTPVLPKKPFFTGQIRPGFFDRKKFDQFITDHAARVKVYKTVECPNVKSIDGAQHSIACPLCRRGFIDRDPIETYVSFQSQALSKMIEADADWDDQQALATFTAGIDITYLSKIEVLDYTNPFNQRVQKQKGDIDRLFYSAFKVHFIVDQNGKDYIPFKDFKLDNNGDVQWLFADRPKIGDIYTIYYDYFVTFRAVKAAHNSRWGQEKINGKFVPVEYQQAWYLKRDFFAERTDSNGNLLEANRIIR